MRKLNICVDMDDTIEDLIGAWLDEINSRNGTHFTAADITEWNMEHCLGLTYDQMYPILYEPEFWDKVQPYQDAQKYLKLINEDERFNLYIVTNTHYGTYTNKMEKCLMRHFPFLNWKQVIGISNKQLLNADVLVDDYEANLFGGSYDKILIDMPYNTSVESIDINKEMGQDDYNSNIIKRAANWESIYNYIDRKAKYLDSKYYNL